MEFWRKKNTDTRVVFPIQKNDGTFITGAADLDSEFALYGAHGAGAPSFGDCTHEATEIASTALYYLDVSAAEINDDYGAVIQIKSSSAGAITQVLDIHTRPDEVDVVKVLGTALTETSGGYLAAGFKKLFDVASPVLTAASVNQTGDAFAAIGDVHATDLPAVAAMLTDIHATDLPAVKSDTAAILADTGELQAEWENGGRLDLILDAASAPTAAAVADAVWDEALSGHAAGGSAGAALTGAGSAGDPWTTTLPGAYGAGTAGALIGDIPAVKADTSSLLKGRYNRNDTDPVTGDETVFEDDSTTVHKSGPAYKDIAGTMPFDGAGANRRDRMT